MPIACTPEGKSGGSGPLPDQMSRTAPGPGWLARAAERTRWRNGDPPAERTTIVTVQDTGTLSLLASARVSGCRQNQWSPWETASDPCQPPLSVHAAVPRTRTRNLRLPQNRVVIPITTEGLRPSHCYRATKGRKIRLAAQSMGRSDRVNSDRKSVV